MAFVQPPPFVGRGDETARPEDFFVFAQPAFVSQPP